MKLVAENRKALSQYEFHDKFEAGIKLLGPEVKSVRLGKVKLSGSYVKIVSNQPRLVGMWIGVYPKAFGKHRLDPLRTRALLLQRKEIAKLSGLDSQRGWAIVPLKIYIKENLVKLEIGAGRHLKKRDRREILRRRDLDRQVERFLKDRS